MTLKNVLTKVVSRAIIDKHSKKRHFSSRTKPLKQRKEERFGREGVKPKRSVIARAG